VPDRSLTVAARFFGRFQFSGCGRGFLSPSPTFRCERGPRVYTFSTPRIRHPEPPAKDLAAASFRGRDLPQRRGAIQTNHSARSALREILRRSLRMTVEGSGTLQSPPPTLAVWAFLHHRTRNHRMRRNLCAPRRSRPPLPSSMIYSSRNDAVTFATSNRNMPALAAARRRF